MVSTVRISSSQEIGADLARWSGSALEPAVQRMRVLTMALTSGGAPSRLPDLIASVETEVGADPARIWLARAALGGDLPSSDELQRIVRTARLDGTWAALQPVLVRLRSEYGPSRMRRVEIARDTVTVDVHHTASADFLSGIQRVVGETVRRWRRDHPIVLGGWTPDLQSMNRLSPDACARFEPDRLDPVLGPTSNSGEGTDVVLIPWRGVHVVPELAAEPARCDRLRAMGEVGATEMVFVSFDCIPITSGETTHPPMRSYFAQYLGAVRHAARVATISEPALVELAGWKSMLGAAGHVGPEIAEVRLPVHAQRSSEEDLTEARRLCIGVSPVVLVVGSYEPRKNHLAVLHAAERLWRRGVDFELLFVGSNAWHADRFHSRCRELQQDGRPIQTLPGLPDRLLWALYRTVHCVLFPSLNEGFGLPVAEALAAGTPVITSNFGSMREIAAPGGEPLGAVLVDPRDDHSIEDGLERLLTDAELHRRLRDETLRHTLGSWDDYAAALWDFLVKGRPPA